MISTPVNLKLKDLKHLLMAPIKDKSISLKKSYNLRKSINTKKISEPNAKEFVYFRCENTRKFKKFTLYKDK
jgi:hypothetical protein